jgi:hypothetical protein
MTSYMHRQARRLTRRQAVKQAVAATVLLGLAECPYRTARGQSGKPQGLALSIGLNYVNPRAYDGWNGKLSGCIPDAKQMTALATQIGCYDRKMLLDSQATIAEVSRHIAWAANELLPGDLFLLSCSSHGSQYPDRNRDESDSRDETWCLWDGQWIDDERWDLFQRFKEGVRIILISDNCHSGTTERVVPVKRSVRDAQSRNSNLQRTRSVQSKIELAASRAIDDVQKKLVDNWLKEGEDGEKRVEEYLELTKKNVATKNQEIERVGAKFNLSGNQASPFRMMPSPLADYLATVQNIRSTSPGRTVADLSGGIKGLSLSACQDDQTALDVSSGGLFSMTLLETYRKAGQGVTYGQLFDAVYGRIRAVYPDHLPNKSPFGGDDSLLSETAFKI